ncbi:MAG: DNA mismatch repair endonuclease MutL [Flavobacteriaceae bacterium]|nr:DNA mismatch repair endonuclease MutL [Flavobacteriaceae bacterium]
MSDLIQLLPDNVANQIAAGEVVQRPSSVVKELLENAVDASATEIKLIIKDAGKTLIQVIDNGFGMSQTDARLAFERHATSKIKTANDLYNLHSNGFRGEALASIAAISHVTLKTKQENTEIGTQININGGEIISQKMVTTGKGSSFEVKNLFYNIPARRNFLKSNAVETRHIIDAFQRVAFTYPNISFSLFHNDSEIYNLPLGKLNLNSGNLRQRIVNILGSNTNEKLVPIKEETDILKIEGFITKPNFAKKKRGEQFFFVNNRFIKSAYLHHAVVNAFEGLLNHGYHPSYFLYLTVPPNSIDINIHPTKTEIKFDNERDLYAIIRSTIKHSLGQYNVAPALDFERDSTLDTPYSFKSKTKGQTPSIEVDPDYNPFKADSDYSYKSHKKEIPANWETLYLGNEAEKEIIDNIEVESVDISQQLFDESNLSISHSTHQIHKKYIVSSIKSGMVLIDQNYAHQRILYEKYLKKITIEDFGKQQLLFPLKININKSDISIIKELKDDLNGAGFNVANISKDSVIFDSIPLTISQDQVIGILEVLIENIKNEVPDSNFGQIDIIAKSFAKSLAIKSGVKLTNKEQENILNKLFLCKEPNFSPFGKQTYITITSEELENKFK